MEVLIRFPEGFPLDDLFEVSEILRDARIFTPNVYDVQGFIRSGWVDRTPIVLLPDLNIVSHWVQIAKGASLRDNEDGRRAAAVLGFAQCLDILIEPSIAFHELAPHQGDAVALEKLAWFRAADNSHPQAWINAALGRVQKLAANVALPEIGLPNLSDRPKRWRQNYVIALRIAALELDVSLTPLTRILELLRWMNEDYYVAGPAAMLACAYFAPSFPRGGVFRWLRSSDRERAIKGVQNTTWDITHLSDLTRRILRVPAENPRSFIFATLDGALSIVAGLVLGDYAQGSPEVQLAGSLRSWWTEDDARSVATAYFRCDAGAKERSEARRRHIDGLQYADLTAQGEATLRSIRF